jgi:hypothetical protein
MSEQTPNPEGGNTSRETPAADEFKPITSQDELNRVISERVQRERAKFSDYRDVKSKAERVEQAETELAAAKAEAEAATADVPAKVADALKAHLIAVHEIDTDDAELFLTANDPELLLKQVQRLVGREADRKKHGNVVPREGNTPPVGGDEKREFARNLFSVDK